jgi:GLPGLI family protein
MKHIRNIKSVFILLCISNIQLLSQYRDISKKIIIDDCKYAIIYTYKYINDTVKKNPKYDKQVLEIGDSLSHYYSVYGDKVDSIYYNFSNHRQNKDGSDGINPHKEAGLQKNERPKYENYYTSYPKKELLTALTAISYNEFIYEEPVPKFEWKIQADTMTVLGYKCIKAITTFRGRTYEVWFTPFIPIRQGPWKLNGLPGLILKATDTKGYFEWTVTGIEKPQNRKIYFYNFDKNRVQKVTRKEAMYVLHQRWKDPMGLKLTLNPNLKSSSYREKTGKAVTVKRGEISNYQLPYIPIPELE